MFENKKANGVNYSRYIASWANVCRNNGIEIYYDDRFVRWLQIEGCNADEIYEIKEMANNGRFELERSAEKFLLG